LSALALLLGCLAMPTATRSPAESGVAATAVLVDAAALAELFDDERMPSRLVAVELELRNASPESLTFTSSRAMLMGPRQQFIRAIEPTAIPRYVSGGPLQAGVSTPPFAGPGPMRESTSPVVALASERAWRSQALAPGEVGHGWLYFPVAAARLADEIPQRWWLVVSLERPPGRRQDLRIRLAPPAAW
jgi:hypothetical protein